MKKRSIKKKDSTNFIRRVILAALGIVLGINVYLANANTLLGNQLPMPLGYGAAVVLSGSMEPTFSKDDLIFVKETDELNVGDIVVYQSGNELIVHRIVNIDGDMMVTQGDANNAADPAFEKSAVKGVVIGWIPQVGMLVNILKTPAGIILILVSAFLLVELSFQKQKDKDEQELDAIKEEIRRLKKEQEELRK